MVIRREAMVSKGIGTAAAAAVNLRRANLVFAKHDVTLKEKEPEKIVSDR